MDHDAPTSVDTLTRDKWDRAAKTFDFMAGVGPDKRWGAHKRALFSAMDGRVLFLALGTGLDIQFFPPRQDIIAIDISPSMLARANERVDNYDGNIDARAADVHHLDFDDDYFDQIFTSCTFCSVPNPVAGLRQLFRVLKPGGKIRMFEHTGSRFCPFKLLMDIMTPLTRKFGPDVNRPTVAHVIAAGFEIDTVNYIISRRRKNNYCDKAIHHTATRKNHKNRLKRYCVMLCALGRYLVATGASSLVVRSFNEQSLQTESQLLYAARAARHSHWQGCIVLHTTCSL